MEEKAFKESLENARNAHSRKEIINVLGDISKILGRSFGRTGFLAQHLTETLITSLENNDG